MHDETRPHRTDQVVCFLVEFFRNRVTVSEVFSKITAHERISLYLLRRRSLVSKFKITAKERIGHKLLHSAQERIGLHIRRTGRFGLLFCEEEDWPPYFPDVTQWDFRLTDNLKIRWKRWSELHFNPFPSRHYRMWWESSSLFIYLYSASGGHFEKIVLWLQRLLAEDDFIYASWYELYSVIWQQLY